MSQRDLPHLLSYQINERHWASHRNCFYWISTAYRKTYKWNLIIADTLCCESLSYFSPLQMRILQVWSWAKYRCVIFWSQKLINKDCIEFLDKLFRCNSALTIDFHQKTPPKYMWIYWLWSHNGKNFFSSKYFMY